MSSIVCAKQTPLYFYLQVKNKPYEPTGKNAFILENDAVGLQFVPLTPSYLLNSRWQPN
jgi:hypothetical protein